MIYDLLPSLHLNSFITS